LQNGGDQIVLTLSSMSEPVATFDLASQLTHAVLDLSLVLATLLPKFRQT
jgi:hypothetical protein